MSGRTTRQQGNNAWVHLAKRGALVNRNGVIATHCGTRTFSSEAITDGETDLLCQITCPRCIPVAEGLTSEERV